MEQEQKTKKDLFLPISIVIAAVVIGGAVIYSNGLKSTGKNGATPAPGEVVEMNIIPEDKILGDSNAGLTMFEFSDYECPYCAKFHKLTRPEIVSNYIDTGKIKAVFRAMPFHSDSLMDIQAVWCAGQQNKYWEMHDTIFNKKDTGETLTADSLEKYAGDINLNKTDFSTCLTAAKDTEKINEIATAAQNAGILATPITLIAKELPIKLDSASIIAELQGGSSVIYVDGGVIIIGAQPFSTYQTEIDKLLQ